MGYFSIDFNKFKPSSKTAQPSVTPSTVDRLNTNLQRLQPTPPPSPTPAPTPTPQPQMQVQEQPQTGWGKVSAALNKPSEWIQSLLTGGKTYEEAYGDKNSGFYKFNDFTRKASVPYLLSSKYRAKSDENWNQAMENDTSKKVGGFAWRMLADPLNVIPFGKIGNVIGKGASKVDDVLKLSKFGDKIIDTARNTPKIANIIEKVNPYFRNPTFGKMLRETEGITNQRLNKLYKLIKETAENLSPAQQRRIGQLLEGGIDTSAKYEKLAAPLRTLTEKIGREAVDLGILSSKSFRKYKGAYMKHIFDKYMDVQKTSGFMRRSAPGIGNQFNKARKGVEGYIREFAAPTFAGLGSSIKDIEAAKFYKKLANDFGAGVDVVKKGRKIVERVVPEGFQYAPHAIKDVKVAKFFKNKSLPTSIIDYINKTTVVKKADIMSDFLNVWKKGKTIWNPAYHARNLMSNQILSDMSTGRGLPRTIVNYFDSIKQYRGKGGQAFVNAAADSGLIKQTRYGSALDEFLDMSKITSKEGGNFITKALKKYDTSTAKFQQFSEETAKLNVFKAWVEKLAKDTGKTIKVALKDPDIVKKATNAAEEAIFSPYKLGKVERDIASKVIPFYSFTRQVIPFTAKTLVNNPARIAKYSKLKREVENFSPDQARPGYAENFVRLPFKNKDGKQAYFDPTYILPFGNVFSPMGNEDKGKLPFGLGFNPLFTETAQQMANKDFYWDQPITKYESEGMKGENLKARAGHAFRTASPQVLNNLISKVFPAVTGKKDYAGRDRNVIQALMDTFAGLKTQFIGEEKGILDKYYQGKSDIRSRQNDIKKILNDNSLTQEEKRKKLQKILQK